MGRKTKTADLEATLDFLLSYLSLSDRMKYKAQNYHKVTLPFFTGAVPFHSEWFTKTSKALTDQDVGGIFEDVTPHDLDGKVDCTVLGNVRKADGSGTMPMREAFGLYRTRTVPAKEIRGRVKLFFPTMIQLTVAMVYPLSGEFESARSIYGWSNRDSVWINAGLFNHPDAGKIIPEDWQAIPMVCMGQQFSERYDWHVEIGYSGFPTLRFRTTMEGARSVFKLRDIPPGKSRRTMLRNWVEEHWRTVPVKNAGTDSKIVKVHKHMRGAIPFKWNDLHGKILPSAFDLDELENIKQEAGYASQ